MPNSKQRRKHELLPITYDELLSNSSMTGLISFLEVPPHSAVEAESGGKSSGAPNLGAPELPPDTSARSSDVIPFPGLVPPPSPDKSESIRPDPSIGAPNLGAPILATGDTLFTSDSTDIVYRPSAEVREMRQAQDGHTIGEQRLYEALWRLSRPVERHARAITIGERTLAAQANMSYSAAQDNARGLIRKLAIEVRSATSKNAPKTYVVFSYEEILRRRRAAGLTHYVKRTSAVELVDLASFGAPSSGAPKLSEPSTSASFGAPEVPAVQVPESEGFPREILAALRKTVLKADDDAALRIRAECRKVAADVTDREITELILSEAPAIARNKSIQNPMGVLIRHIPRCCGETLKQLRAEKADESERSKRESLEQQKAAAAILQDPSSSEDDRSWAEMLLSGYNAAGGQ
jgi:hypothetical protein